MQSAHVKVGLCGFTIGAREYFETFPLVEVQQTFYDPPSPAVLRRWRDGAPEGFEFTLKAWQVITHASSSRTYRRMKRPMTAKALAECGAFRWNDTTRAAHDLGLECARILRATSLLFQCPASFRPTEENMDNMRTFFGNAARPEGLRMMWEPRGPAWDDEAIAAMCRELELTHVVDPFVRRPVTGGVTYWRLHGIGNHYHRYTDEELAKLREWIPGDGTTYVMFNNIPRVDDARRFVELIVR